jgi:serine/threonine protein kinase/tetratricopeptide (TPR) repeat protein
MPEHQPQVDEVFDEALRRAAGQDRARYLNEVCGGDLELTRRVERLLKAVSEAGSFLETPARDPSPTIDQSPVEGPDAVIGPYKLIEPIGEGGMGTVWMAQQTEPVKRVVALKLIKAGMDSKQVLARFEAERQALALMDHPNIAKVLDAGTIPFQIADCRLQIGKTGPSNLQSEICNLQSPGRPYFVMELVKGTPITKYCDDKHLSVRERLELFGDVCRAVQHAHQKGIIHRDLKPSNILIAPFDGKPVVKVIDFGVAKATGQRLTDATLFTGFGAVVGTPEYMSPEQAETNNQDIDTRSDIYSLGVLLYELLTGSTPLTKKRVKEAALLEVLRVIREEEPPKPSTRLSSTEELPSISAQRQMEPAKLTKLVRGELDWIVMKALEKDRNRRYETANAFAMDVQRYLADEPVAAGPPSAGYRMRKFMRRHRGPVLAASLVMLALVAGIVGTSWQAMRAEQGWRAETERAEGERRAKLDAQVAQEKEAEARRAAQGAEKQARDSEADYMAFSRFLVEDVLCAPRPQKQLGGRGINVTVKQALLEAAGRMTERFRGQPRAEAVARHDLGVTFRHLGELAAAEEQLRTALDLRCQILPPADPTTLNTQNSLAVLLVERGKADEAIPLFEDVVKWRKAKLGPDHAHTLATMDNLANAYRTVGRLPDALPLFEETLACMREKLTTNHPDTLTAMNNMAVAYGDAGKLHEQVAMLENCVEAARKVFGPDSPGTLTGMNNLARAYWGVKRADQAIPLLEKVVELRMGKIGPDHPHTLTSLHSLGIMYTRCIVGPDFKPCYLTRLPALRKRLPADSLVWVAVTAATADQLLDDRNYSAAEPLLRECLAAREARQPNAWTTFHTKSRLGEALAGRQKYDDAESLLLAGYEGLKRCEATIPQERRVCLTQALEGLVQCYIAWGKKDQTDNWRKRLDAHNRKVAESAR